MEVLWQAPAMKVDILKEMLRCERHGEEKGVLTSKCGELNDRLEGGEGSYLDSGRPLSPLRLIMSYLGNTFLFPLL